MSCACPSTPEITRPVDGPVACACCGHALELTCAGKCGPEHHRAAIAAAAPLPAAATPMKKERARTCGCGGALAPFKRKCPRCAPPAGTLSSRTYTEKPCRRCQRPFMPTGPRALDCPACRAGA